MLDIIRKNTKVIIWTVVLSFVLWGGVSVGTSLQKKGRYAGEVFNKPVTFQEFNSFHQSAQIFSFTDDNNQDPDVLRHKAWQNLIYSREAKRLKIKVSDDEVRRELRRILEAQGLANATPEMYKRWLRSAARMEAKDFEKQLREILRVQKLVAQAISNPGPAPTEEDIHDLFRLEEQRLSGEMLLFNTPEDVQNFLTQATDAASWKKMVEIKGFAVLPVPDQMLYDFLRAWQLPREMADRLMVLPEGSVSEEIPARGKSGVFLMQHKKTVTDADFTAEKKEEYTEKAVSQQKKQAFFAWHLEIMQRARLHDFSIETQV